MHGLAVLRELAGAATPIPVDGGAVAIPAGPTGTSGGVAGVLLLSEALAEMPREARSADDWRSIGRSLAGLHGTTGTRYGLDVDGFFGPLRQDNRPVPECRWAEFYAERRLLPRLAEAADSGHLPPDAVPGIERIAGRLPDLAGPEPLPTLLHGDAQQNNFLSTARGPVLLDVSPYFGHHEVELALIDYLEPVPPHVFDGYRELMPIDADFAQRRDLWRLHGYLAVVTVDGANAFGRRYLRRLMDVVARYR